MNHLTDEQLEDIVQGSVGAELAEGMPAGRHIAQCPQCRARLQEKRALAERLRRAFGSIHAGADLADRIRGSLVHSDAGRGNPPWLPRAGTGTSPYRVHHRLWSSLAAAAAILILALPVALYFNTSSQAKAAQAELVALHHQNLDSLDGLIVNEDPNELADYLKDATGHACAMLCTGSGLDVCGCCVKQFRGRSVGSYVVKTPGGTVSVLVIPDPPKSLGLRATKTAEPTAHPSWHAECGDCRIASVHIGDLSYYAIGETRQEELQDVLRNLIR